MVIKSSAWLYWCQKLPCGESLTRATLSFPSLIHRFMLNKISLTLLHGRLIPAKVICVQLSENNWWLQLRCCCRWRRSRCWRCGWRRRRPPHGPACWRSGPGCRECPSTKPCLNTWALLRSGLDMDQLCLMWRWECKIQMHRGLNACDLTTILSCLCSVKREDSLMTCGWGWALTTCPCTSEVNPNLWRPSSTSTSPSLELHSPAPTRSSWTRGRCSSKLHWWGFMCSPPVGFGEQKLYVIEHADLHKLTSLFCALGWRDHQDHEGLH